MSQVAASSEPSTGPANPTPDLVQMSFTLSVPPGTTDGDVETRLKIGDAILPQVEAGRMVLSFGIQAEGKPENGKPTPKRTYVKSRAMIAVEGDDIQLMLRVAEAINHANIEYLKNRRGGMDELQATIHRKTVRENLIKQAIAPPDRPPIIKVG